MGYHVGGRTASVIYLTMAARYGAAACALQATVVLGPVGGAVVGLVWVHGMSPLRSHLDNFGRGSATVPLHASYFLQSWVFISILAIGARQASISTALLALEHKVKQQRPAHQGAGNRQQDRRTTLQHPCKRAIVRIPSYYQQYQRREEEFFIRGAY